MEQALNDPSEARAQRSRIMAFETALLELPQIDIPILHHFAPGLYLREAPLVPAGTTFTGAIHKTEHFFVLLSGEATIVNEAGEAQRLTGPHIIHSTPGTKRVGFCHTDVRCMNVHHNPNNETDVAAIEARLATNDFDDPELIAVCGGDCEAIT